MSNLEFNRFRINILLLTKKFYCSGDLKLKMSKDGAEFAMNKNNFDSSIFISSEREISVFI